MDVMTLDGRLFTLMILSGSENLRRNRSIVNELNVFPIPDGDTGDNMYMTFRAGCDNLGAEETGIERASAEAARGMLLGARGNSGVILSRIFAGIADGLAGNATSDARLMCGAFGSGVRKAYGAVSVPVEGTMLTVFREAAEHVAANANHYRTLRELFDDLLAEIRRSLERTPERLEVLRQAGVVDSGGAGLYYIVEGMKQALDAWSAGTADALTPPVPDDGAQVTESKPAARLADGGAELGYCVEFLLQLMPSRTDVSAFDTDALAARLTELGGESIAAFREEDIVRVHVHTRSPGAVLDCCQRYGEYLKVKVENMTLQHENTVVRNRFSAPGYVPAKARRRAKLAFVAVASGEGVRKVFREAGADAVIDGGQSMNPSAEAFLRAFDAVDADTVIVLPNNKNILLAARQAAELCTGSDIRVFGSRSIGEGYAALSMADRESGDADAVLAGMRDAAEGVVTGAVARAVRDACAGGTNVRKGSFLGFVEDTIHACEADRTAAGLALAERLDAGAHDVLLLFRGDGVDAAEAEALRDALAARYPRTETVLLEGGQPVYDYILVLE